MSETIILTVSVAGILIGILVIAFAFPIAIGALRESKENNIRAEMNRFLSGEMFEENKREQEDESCPH